MNNVSHLLVRNALIKLAHRLYNGDIKIPRQLYIVLLQSQITLMIRYVKDSYRELINRI